tara:strand:+ start:3543 stop:4097 length:555 start_codon:yes stop_codon:yes gene_type:complete
MTTKEKEKLEGVAGFMGAFNAHAQQLGKDIIDPGKNLARPGIDTNAKFQEFRESERLSGGEMNAEQPSAAPQAPMGDQPYFAPGDPNIPQSIPQYIPPPTPMPQAPAPQHAAPVVPPVIIEQQLSEAQFKDLIDVVRGVKDELKELKAMYSSLVKNAEKIVKGGLQNRMSQVTIKFDEDKTKRP